MSAASRACSAEVRQTQMVFQTRNGGGVPLTAVRFLGSILESDPMRMSCSNCGFLYLWWNEQMDAWASLFRTFSIRIFREIFVLFGGICFLIFLVHRYNPNLTALLMVGVLGPVAINTIGIAVAYVLGRVVYLVGKVVFGVVCLPFQSLGYIPNSALLHRKVSSIDQHKEPDLFFALERSAQQRIFLYMIVGICVFLVATNYHWKLFGSCLLVVLMYTFVEEVNEHHLRESVSKR